MERVSKLLFLRALISVACLGRPVVFIMGANIARERDGLKYKPIPHCCVNQLFGEIFHADER